MKKLLLSTAIILALNVPVMATAHDGPPATAMESAISRLPHDKAEDFRDALQSAHDENKDLYDQVKQIHHEMHDILIADQFDQNAFTAKSQELRQLHDKINANLDEAFATAVSELSVNERLMLAQAMDHAHKMHKAMRKAHKQDQSPSAQ